MKLRKWAVFFSMWACGLSLLHLVRVRSPRQLLLRTLKAMGEVLSPVLMLMGAAGAVIGARAGSPVAVITGWVGAALSLDYIVRVGRARANATQALPPGQRAAAARARPIRLRNTPRWQRDVPFWTNPESGETLCCDLWLPPREVQPSGLAILYLHGGGFFSCHKDFGTRFFFRYLAGQGHVVMDADYRLAPRADLHTIQADARRALAWLKANASALGADPQRVIVIGGSAGALLALLVAYTPGHPDLTPPDLAGIDLSVRGVVSYYGIVDLADLYHGLAPLMDRPARFEPAPEMFDRPLAKIGVHAGAWIKGAEPEAMRIYLRENAAMLRIGPRRGMKILLGGSPEEAPQMYDLFSPLHHAGPGSPPTLLFHGEHDYLLPPSGPRSLFRKLESAGVPAVYVEFPKTEHTFDLFLPRISPPARAALRHLSRFLAQF